MQPAYIACVSESRPYREWRRLRLVQLLEEAGGPRKLAGMAGTVDTYLTAMKNGNRDVGDDIANKLERATGRPSGWMDTDPSSEPARPMPPTPSEVIEWLGILIASAPEGHLQELAETMKLLVTSRGNARHYAATVDLMTRAPAIGEPEKRQSSAK